MIPGQKMLNVTYMAKAKDGAEWIEGETCMNIQMAEKYADLLLADESECRFQKALDRGSAFMSAEIIIDQNERLKDRFYISGSIKGFEEVKEW